jgi:hypothetical protein
MTPEKARELLAEAKANHARLESCRRHEFVQLDGAQFAKFKCRHCGGEARAHEVLWYRRGLEHAGGRP